MIKIRSKIRQLQNDQEGATLMEFGLIAGPFMLLILGIMDIGYQGYLDTLAKSKLHEVARAATTGGYSVSQIEQQVKDGLDPLLLKDARVEVEVVSYFDFTNIGKPEKISLDNDGNGALDTGDCYLDGNGNGEFDVDYGTSGRGGPDDIVNYTVTITSPRMFPFPKLFGRNNQMEITNSTALRNQPYGAQSDIQEICES